MAYDGRQFQDRIRYLSTVWRRASAPPVNAAWEIKSPAGQTVPISAPQNGLGTSCVSEQLRGRSRGLSLTQGGRWELPTFTQTVKAAMTHKVKIQRTSLISAHLYLRHAFFQRMRISSGFSSAHVKKNTWSTSRLTLERQRSRDGLLARKMLVQR